MSSRLSVVTPCFNDLGNLASTLESVRLELGESDELLIIDSSAEGNRVRSLAEEVGLRCAHRYFWMPPSGVFRAQNRGILESTGEWIQIINSGDRLCPGARKEIEDAVNALPFASIHVFRQRAIAPGVPPYVFSPTSQTIWPHQSTIVHQSVYRQEGTYPEEFRYCAEQLFFARVRRTQRWRLHAPILTEYLLGGFSSGVGYRHMKEAYALYRAFDRGFVHSMIRGVALPVLRMGVEKTFGIAAVGKVKCRLFSHYSRG